MTDHGRAFAINRLTSCPTAEALRRVWQSLGQEYQHDKAVQETKDRLKAGFGDK